jgi:NitT/TauT family transport system substrate-binding protein
VLALVLLAGCGGAEDPGRVAIALNWKPEPEFGGIFEALRDGIFAARDLDIELTGGPGAPVIQMVASGKVRFGIASADEVVIARARGSDVVALFATYQISPQGIMVHAERGFESLAAVFASPGVLAVEPGLPYVKFLEAKYGFGRLEVVPYTYSIAPFLTNPDMAQQVFVTAEPIAARRAGANPRVFLVADSGYNPYTAVVIASGASLRDAPARADALRAALREGWRRYLDDPLPANTMMAERNPEMDPETFRLAAAAQAPLIETGETRRLGLGAMTVERWKILGEQLRDLGLIDRVPAPESCFVPDAAAAAGETR